MKAVSSPTAVTTQPAATSSRRSWHERSARLYSEFEAAARALVRRAFQGAFAEDELDDIYSNAWLGTLRALEPRHAELTDEEVRSYVFAAVAHQASRELRRRKRKPTAPLDTAEGRPDEGLTPDERAVSNELSQVTRDLLASLPPRRRSVILLRYGWGLSPQQVCGIVKNLSPRAYRKEITRGVDELTDKVRAFERGEWCAERETVLKAYASGVADLEQVRQAKAHLSHCRGCNDFVARLTGHLHDLGGAALAPTAIDGLHGELSWADRLTDIGERARDAIAGVIGRVPPQGSEEAAAAVASSGGARGAGVVGAGVLAKLAGVSAVSKVAAACVGGGVAATACIAAGVGPAGVGGREPDRAPGHVQTAGEPSPDYADEPPLPTPDVPTQVEAGPAFTEPPATPDRVVDDPAPETQSSDSTDGASAQPPTPIAPEAPSETEEFGVEASAMQSSTPSSSASGGAGVPHPGRDAGRSDVRQEFRP